MNHACGQCGKIFATEDSYTKHQCPQHKPQEAPKLSEGDILAAVTAARQNKKPNG